MTGTLYIVSTPIGNLEDITPRALGILRKADVIACEDTRHTGKLLNHFGIETRTISYHEHNEIARTEELCAVLTAGKNVALVSDAGTPLISDPGYRLVSAATEKGTPVVVIPGVSAFVAALSGSGLPSDQFLFAGFLPARASARRAKLEELAGLQVTLIFYEAPHRITATLRDAQAVMGNRRAVVARELTKLHEEFLRGTLEKLSDAFADSSKARGEMVLIIEGASDHALPQSPTASTSTNLIERIKQLQAEGLEEKVALKKAAKELGLKRDEAYRLLLAQKNRLNK
jgi:16S rRNA (cytidine1402-2'-O)-methyltransferase